MTTPTPPIDGQAARLTTTQVDDPDESTLVCVVHLNVKPAWAECRAVTRAGLSRFIGRSPEGMAVDSASAEYYPDGTVRLWMSCYPAGMGGASAAVGFVDFPSALQALDAHLKMRIYERVTNTNTATHEAIEEIAREQAALVMGAAG